jgi:integrase
MKAGQVHVVPLAPTAVAILEALPRCAGPFVFSTTGGERPISGYGDIKAKVDSFMPGVAAWVLHDIRRTMRTGLSALRVPDTVAELCIGHTQKGLHKVYDQHSYLDEKRHALDAWASRLLSIVEPDAQSNVTPTAARGSPPLKNAQG